MPIEDVEEKSSQINRKIMKYFGLFMAIAYMIIGAIIISIPNEMLGIAPFQKTGAGVLFIFYGLYRFYKVYRQYFQRRV